jgi:hypothetical protein
LDLEGNIPKFDEGHEWKWGLGENPLRFTTQDKKGLVFIVILFIPIKNNESKVVKIFKRTIF